MNRRIAVLAVMVVTGGLLLPSGADTTSTAPREEEIQTLLRQLDDARFTTRQQAEERLRNMGLAVVPRLRTALDEKLPLEVRRRLERIVADLTRLSWHRDAGQAFAEARRTGKPVLVFSTIGEPAGFA